MLVALEQSMGAPGGGRLEHPPSVSGNRACRVTYTKSNQGLTKNKNKTMTSGSHLSSVGMYHVDPL